jgi:hypothetical protein
MIGNKFVVCAAAIMAVLGAYGLSLAAEDSPKPPQPPIRIKTVDLQEGEGPAKLKLAGTAGPGTTLYIFVDDAPFVKLVADDEGKWSTEGEVQFEGDPSAQHMVRAEQYDPETRMLAGRAMVTIARKPSAEP